MLYLLFFLLKDGPYLVLLILESLPLSSYVKQHLFAKFAAVARATVKGTVAVALAQGALGGFAFWIAGLDGSILWGALMAFLSLIPAVGSAIIWVPAAIYLFATGQLWQGAFIVGFFVIVIGLVDNILRPLLVGKDTRMPDYLILIATLGGMEIYGINGFVIGPLIAALFIACWNLLSDENMPAIPMKSMKSLLRKRKIAVMNSFPGRGWRPASASVALCAADALPVDNTIHFAKIGKKNLTFS